MRAALTFALGLLAVPAAAADSLRVEPDELTRTFIVSGHRALDASLAEPGQDIPGARDFEIDVLYNLKAYHIGLNVGVGCEGVTQRVVKVTLDGVQFQPQLQRAIVFYVVHTDADGDCKVLSEQMQIERLVDGDWYASLWGARLVRR